MDGKVHLSIELNDLEHEALSAIASDSGMSLSEVAAEAVRSRIDQEQDFFEAVREGLADIAAGRVITDEEYTAHAAERRRRWLAERQR